jgi:Histidine kinase-, DNA gyrase B-, and HSP90-like ATPase
MPGGGTLRIGLENRSVDRQSPARFPPGNYIVISISDTGTGMDEVTLARAFDPFFTTKQIGSGSGLGLPMVQGFAAQSGGALQIWSKLAEGTTVELWLPQVDGPPRRSPIDLRWCRKTLSLRVFDDYDDVRLMPCFSEAESRGGRDDIDVVRVPANQEVACWPHLVDLRISAEDMNIGDIEAEIDARLITYAERKPISLRVWETGGSELVWNGVGSMRIRRG